MEDYILQRQKIISQLISARLEKGMSQQQLANLIGTQKSNISRIESGTQNVTVDMLIKISDALGKKIDFTLNERSDSMTNIYELRLYNDVLLRFTLEEKALEGLQAELHYIDETKKDLLPLNMELSNSGILKWLQRRVIPKNRAFVDEILKSLGLSHNNTRGIIDVCKGLSLNDSYWVVPEGFNGTFEEYNLYENRFSEILSLVAYTGAYGGDKAFSTSPELTTGGMLRKAWRYIENDGIYLYKGGTEGAANAGNEPYSEYYAYQIAEAMGLNAVEYDLENWKGILASKCKLFTDIDTSFVPIGNIVKEGGIRACLDYYKKLDENFYEVLCSMLVFDAVIYNEDRHFGNFGILRNNHTGEIIGPAPIFDNGLALFNFGMPDDFKDISEYAKTRTSYYGVPFEVICSEVIGKKQIAQLRRLLNFKFKRHPSINLPEERLSAIEKHIEQRTRELIALPRNRALARNKIKDVR